MDHVTLAWAVVGHVFLIFATMRRILVIGETFNFQFLLNSHFANFMSFLASAWYGMPWITYDNLLFAMMNISCATLEISYLIKVYQEKYMYRQELLHRAKTGITVLVMFIMGCYLIIDDYYLTKLSAVLAAALAGAVSLIPSKDTMQNCLMGVSSTAWMVYAQRRNDRGQTWLVFFRRLSNFWIRDVHSMCVFWSFLPRVGCLLMCLLVLPLLGLAGPARGLILDCKLLSICVRYH